jgi:hypothetical protein
VRRVDLRRRNGRGDFQAGDRTRAAAATATTNFAAATTAAITGIAAAAARQRRKAGATTRPAGGADEQAATWRAARAPRAALNAATPGSIAVGDADAIGRHIGEFGKGGHGGRRIQAQYSLQSRPVRSDSYSERALLGQCHFQTFDREPTGVRRRRYLPDRSPDSAGDDNRARPISQSPRRSRRRAP